MKKNENVLLLEGLTAAQVMEINTKIKELQINATIMAQLDVFSKTKKTYIKYLGVFGVQWTSQTICRLNTAFKGCNIPYLLFAQSDLGV